MRGTDGLTKGSMRLPDRLLAAMVKGVVLCSKCQCECELEVPILGAIIDQELVKKKVIEEQ